MEGCRDFIQCLGHDLSMRILTSIENPSDLIRFSAVSTSWRSFAIENGLAKRLCLKKFPESSNLAHAVEENSKKHAGFSPKFYAYLARGLAASTMSHCISTAVAASSTGKYPEETVQNTLEPRDLLGVRASYWSSMGQTDATIPEKLVYRLISNICIITEIHVQPFQACRGTESSIYSPRAVRFRMGYPKSTAPIGNYEFKASHRYKDNAFFWTYVSPEFPMARENCLQKFKLAEPVLCIGGILQVDLLGRVQSQESDGLYYIRITHVRAVGRPLAPGFDAEILDSSGRFKLNYHPGIKYRLCPSKGKARNGRSRFSGFSEALGGGDQFLSKPMSRDGVAFYFLFMVFICPLFLTKLSQVFSCLGHRYLGLG